jgi:Fe-S-cluster containining protein
MDCRPGCAACCTVISISTPLPGMPGGKPAGQRCIHLDLEDRCRLWGTSEFPRICRDFPPNEEHCGADRDQAFARLADLEAATRADWVRRTGHAASGSEVPA